MLNLYSLDARLAQSRARVAALQGQVDAVHAQIAQVAREQKIARRAWRASVTALASHLRTMYEQDQPDAIAVLLGAASIDDAMTRLDELRRTAQLNRDVVVQTLHAQHSLTRLHLELAGRARQLRVLVSTARQTTAQLERTRAERASYFSTLANERAFNRDRIARLDAEARASAARAQTETRQPQTASAPIAPANAAAPSAAPAAGTLVVTATGYSLPGRTSTGLPTGWGVVAVDPSVIPLGTHLVIPGYGEGVAADTGGSVQGATIDLWFPTPAQAAAWGRRTVTVALH